MTEQDHLQVYTLTLTTRGPLHIGSGQKTPRKEYILNPEKGTVSFLKEQAFFDLLIQNRLVELFEGFCMRRGGDLYAFLYRECGVDDEQIAPVIRYQVSTGGTLDADHSLKDIHRFIRNPQGVAYIPGSSIKGALRSALLYQMIAGQDPRRRQANVARLMDMPMDKRNEKNLVLPEESYLHVLELEAKKPSNAVNSLMRGIQVSDSEQVPDRMMTLTMKQDGSRAGEIHAINLCRECIAPGTAIRFRLTLDQSILKNRITAQTILEAINAFAAYYRQTYEKYFASPYGLSDPGTRNLLHLGGGSGFFATSLAYPYLGEEKGLDFVSRYLSRNFRGHHHEQDQALGISPHTLKYAKHGQTMYVAGACEVSIT